MNRTENDERLQRGDRRSVRLQGYDYSRPGAYFITVCAHARARLFGAVVEGAMKLNQTGQIVAEQWEWIGIQYPLELTRFRGEVASWDLTPPRS